MHLWFAKFASTTIYGPWPSLKGLTHSLRWSMRLSPQAIQGLAVHGLAHLRALKERGLDVETAALRIPMLSEVEELVRWCDTVSNPK